MDFIIKTIFRTTFSHQNYNYSHSFYAFVVYTSRERQQRNKQSNKLKIHLRSMGEAMKMYICALQVYIHTISIQLRCRWISCAVVVVAVEHMYVKIFARFIHHRLTIIVVCVLCVFNVTRNSISHKSTIDQQNILFILSVFGPSFPYVVMSCSFGTHANWLAIRFFPSKFKFNRPNPTQTQKRGGNQNWRCAN